MDWREYCKFGAGRGQHLFATRRTSNRGSLSSDAGIDAGLPFFLADILGGEYERGTTGIAFLLDANGESGISWCLGS